MSTKPAGGAERPEAIDTDRHRADSSTDIQATDGFFSIPLSSLRLDTVTGFNLYLKSAAGGQGASRGKKSNFILYRGADLKFAEEHREKLRQSRVRRLYISNADRQRYLRYMEDNIDPIISSPTLLVSQKTEIIYDSATQLVRDIFADPRGGENLRRAHRMADTTVVHLLNGPMQLGSMLGGMAFDYRIYSHCVNVSVFGVALAQRLGLSGPELKQLGIGLLLHDVGKTMIDPKILKKEGPLTKEEWKVMKTHPQLGVDSLKDSQDIHPASLDIVLHHHEKCSGKGYPDGLKGDDISLFSKIAALADVFDALTTERPYAPAVRSYPALRIMKKEMADDFNPELMRELILLMNTAAEDSEKSA